MRTLQIAAGLLLKELRGSRDEGVIRAARCLEWAARRGNPSAARTDIKDARAHLDPSANHEQARALEQLDRILHPSQRRTRRSANEIKGAGDWCALCGKDAVRFFRSHRGLVPVCERHAQPHMRAHDLSLIQSAMLASASNGVLDGLDERESAVYSMFEDESEASRYSSSGDWRRWLQAWWRKVATTEGVIWAWSYLTHPYLEWGIAYPVAVVRDFRAWLYEMIETHCAEVDARSSQQNGCKGGRPPVITPAQIRKVRQLAAKEVRQVEIAAEVGLSQSHVSRLLKSFK